MKKKIRKDYPSCIYSARFTVRSLALSNEFTKRQHINKQLINKVIHLDRVSPLAQGKRGNSSPKSAMKNCQNGFRNEGYYTPTTNTMLLTQQRWCGGVIVLANVSIWISKNLDVKSSQSAGQAQLKPRYTDTAPNCVVS